MTFTLLNSSFFSRAASKCNWRKKKFCICPPTGKQQFSSPVWWYNLSQMLASPKPDVFMVETYKSMAWAAASFPGEKSYRYDLRFFLGKLHMCSLRKEEPDWKGNGNWLHPRVQTGLNPTPLHNLKVPIQTHQRLHLSWTPFEWKWTLSLDLPSSWVSLSPGKAVIYFETWLIRRSPRDHEAWKQHLVKPRQRKYQTCQDCQVQHHPMKQCCQAPRSLMGNTEFGEREKEASNEGTGLGGRKGAAWTERLQCIAGNRRALGRAWHILEVFLHVWSRLSDPIGSWHL